MCKLSLCGRRIILNLELMNTFWRAIWPNERDRAVALRALWIGMLAAVTGGLVALLFALRTFFSEGFSFFAVVLPIVGGLLLEVAAVSMYRRTPIGPNLALLAWIILGVVPTGIPSFLGLVVLLSLVLAIRGSNVLQRLSRTNGE